MAQPVVSSDLAADAAALQRWLIRQALLAVPVKDVATGFAEGMVRLGLPVQRAHVSVRTLHPQVESIGLTWTREGQRLFEEYGHGSFARIANSSPLYDAIMQAEARGRANAGDRTPGNVTPMTRYRLERGEGTDAYPVLAELRDAGARDYLCFVIPFANDGRLVDIEFGAVVSLTTDRAGGFTDDEIAMLADLIPAFGVALRSGADLAATRIVLDTYLGHDVGRRVLSGEIRRGSVEAISAAILVGDLRGFTALADSTPREQLVSMLGEYLDCLVAPVEAGGGQVLKFLGDGLLATFTFADREASAVCEAALGAAAEALRRIDALNHGRRGHGLPVMSLDLALHAGEVLYGNIGSARRMDFTIVGPAVNEAARLEALCAALDVPLIASRRFVDLLGRPQRFRSLGRQALRGVREPVEVFAVA